MIENNKKMMARRVHEAQSALRAALLAGKPTRQIRDDLAKLTVQAAEVDRREAERQAKRDLEIAADIATAAGEITAAAGQRLIEIKNRLAPPPAPAAVRSAP